MSTKFEAELKQELTDYISSKVSDYAEDWHLEDYVYDSVPPDLGLVSIMLEFLKTKSFLVKPYGDDQVEHVTEYDWQDNGYFAFVNRDEDGDYE